MSKPAFNVTVTTWDGDTEYPETERTINHGDGIHRQWLEKHLFWAIRNNRTVTIEPEVVEA